MLNNVLRLVGISPYLSGLALLGLLVVFPVRALGQQSIDTTKTLSSAEIDRIVRTFTAKEAQFRRALNSYVFRRDALVQSVGMGTQVTGEYHRVSNFTFDEQGVRYEKIILFPMPSVTFTVTPEDLEDLGGVNPFALEPSSADQYSFKYVGKERID